MDQNFKFNVWVHPRSQSNGIMQFGQGLEVFVLCVDDKDKSAHFAENHPRVEGRIKEIDLTGKVPDLKVDEGAAFVENIQSK